MIEVRRPRIGTERSRHTRSLSVAESRTRSNGSSAPRAAGCWTSAPCGEPRRRASAPVDDREPRAAPQGVLGQARHRIHLERRADDEQQAARRASSSDARSIAPAGQQLAEHDHVGLEHGAASAHAGTGTCSSTRSNSSRWPHARQLADRIEPCTSTTRREPAASCRRSTFWVTIASTRPRRSSSASATCAAFGVASASTPEPLRVEVPDLRRVAPEGVDGRVLHRVVLRPDAGRRAEVGDAALRGDAGSGQDDARLRLYDQPGETLGGHA